MPVLVQASFLLFFLEAILLVVLAYVIFRESRWSFHVRAKRRRYLAIAFVALGLLFTFFVLFGGSWVNLLTAVLMGAIGWLQYVIARRYTIRANSESGENL